jgi:hypothetical protein
MNEQTDGIVWRKSRDCESGACVEVAFAKSTRSSSTNCVEVGPCDCGEVRVRDSKDPNGPVLTFTADEWTAFTAGVRAGEFDG